MKVSQANKKQLTGEGSKKPQKKRHIPKADPMLRVSDNVSKAARSSQVAADSAAVAADMIASSIDLMKQTQSGLVQALQESINQSRTLTKRDPVRLVVNRTWDKKEKYDKITSIDILPLTVK